MRSLRTKRGRAAHLAAASPAIATEGAPSEAHARWVDYDPSDDDAEFYDFDGQSDDDVRAAEEHAELTQQTRAATLDAAANPYALSLDADPLRELADALQPITIHQLVGVFCAIASVPEVVPSETWLSQLLELQPRLVTFTAQLVQLHDDVVQRAEAGAITTLVPVAADEAACEEWSRGYVRLYELVDRRFREGETVVLRGFEVRVLAGKPEALEELEEFPEKDTTEESLAHFRKRLASSAAILRERWLSARRAPAPAGKETTAFRGAIGRNDPCVCGSGKRYKRCCARA